ncbi:unnamed protein product [Orchesella dallaii]|uniref:Gamma-interferon-inducible lysosomal thiol reductase n=1 Tax=Orchesella dallaii TaxID=48710 RepID=A0ABP1QHW5_9HEXA
MKWLVVTSLFVLASITHSVSANKRVAKPLVQVYYESLCGDSRRFIQRQLYPVKTSPLGEHFYVDLIPYGKASTTQSGDSYTFDCQHGPDECKGNKLHACAIRHLNESMSFEFVHCSMVANYPPNALDECTTKLGVEKEEIKKCVEGSEGSELLARHGERTHRLTPKLYFVPWITYNGIFNEKKFQQSLSDFKSVICSVLKDEGKTPESCEGIELLAKQVDVGSGSESSWVQQPRDALLQLLVTFCFLLGFI